VRRIERLADQLGTDDALTGVDQAAVGLMGKQQLGDPGDQERVGEPPRSA
jgi:hypothetical protein